MRDPRRERLRIEVFGYSPAQWRRQSVELATSSCFCVELSLLVGHFMRETLSNGRTREEVTSLDDDLWRKSGYAVEHCRFERKIARCLLSSTLTPTPPRASSPRRGVQDVQGDLSPRDTMPKPGRVDIACMHAFH